MAEDQTVTLHDYWRSSASYRVRIALGLKGIEWFSAPVNLLERAHRSEEHLTRHPQGLVPVLEIDGRELIQSLAIAEYLDETRPTPPLLPPDAAGRARVRAMAHVFAMEVHPVCNLSVLAHVAELTGGGREAGIDWMQHFMAPGLAAFEALLDDPATGRFCHGDTPGLADICLVPQLYNARRWGIDIAPCPRSVAIADRCGAMAAFQNARPDAVGSPSE